MRNESDALARPRQLGGPTPLLDTQGIKSHRLPPPRTFPKYETFPHDGREPPSPRETAVSHCIWIIQPVCSEDESGRAKDKAIISLFRMGNRRLLREGMGFSDFQTGKFFLKNGLNPGEEGL